MDQLCITAPGPTPLACATPLSFVPQSCMLTQEQGLHQLTSAVCPHVPTTPADRSQRPFTAPGSGRRYGSPGGYAGADVGAAVDVGEATLLDNMTTRTGGRAAGQRWGRGGGVVGERWGSGGQGWESGGQEYECVRCLDTEGDKSGWSNRSVAVCAVMLCMD